jgi:DNA-binding NarL/FixJ family response regulator
MNGEHGMTTIFIVAQSAIVRAGLESLLQTNDRLVVTGSASALSEAPTDVSTGQTAEVLLVNVGRESEFRDLLEFLSEAAPEEIDFPAVVTLFSLELQSSEYLIRALKSGVRAVLPEDAAADEITAALTSAAAGLFSFSPEIAAGFLSLLAETNSSGSIVESGAERAFQDESIEALTPREGEILEMLGEGASNKSIASQLNISEHTVKFHVASIYGKLGVNSRTEAVTLALRRGLILL